MSETRKLEIAGPYPRVTIGVSVPELDDPECNYYGFAPIAELTETAVKYGDCANVPDAQRLVIAWNCHDDLLDALHLVKSRLDYLRELWGDEGITRSVVDKVNAAIAKVEAQHKGTPNG